MTISDSFTLYFPLLYFISFHINIYFLPFYIFLHFCKYKFIQNQFVVKNIQYKQVMFTEEGVSLKAKSLWRDTPVDIYTVQKYNTKKRRRARKRAGRREKKGGNLEREK